MKSRLGKLIVLGMLIFSISLQLSGCGGGGGGGGVVPTGTVSVSLTDAPGLEYDHVWITVQDIAFHTRSDAGDTDFGWLNFRLAVPVTVDLAALSNGVISAAVWDKITLPVGNYQQIRIFLAPTEDPLTASATTRGLTFNNEVDIGANRYPLRIPTPLQGIRLTGAFQVTATTPLRLAIDFDAGDDVVKVVRNGAVEFILKPRLNYFDLDRAGAITGTLAAPGGFTFANYTGKNFVIKAEQPNAAGTYRVVRRATTIRPDGTFTLYPLPIFGTATTARYDIVIRGRNVETCIVNQVPAHKGTIPATGTSLGPPVILTTGNEYVSSVAISPTGAWMEYYQALNLPGEIPYEIRFRHANPFTGNFFEPLQLSNGPLHVGAWNNGGAIAFASMTPAGGNGTFQAAADALLYDRSGYTTITPGSPDATFGPLIPSAPAVPRSISGTIAMPGGLMGKMTGGGLMFATFGGMIVNTVDVSSLMSAGGTFSMANFPGGTAGVAVPYAFYGLYTLGWGPTALGAGAVKGIDLRTGPATNVTMEMIRIL